MPKNGPGVATEATAAAMEGRGFYNRHSAMQAAGISLLLADWEDAVRNTVVDQGPLLIADYGSSQGRNSMAPMRIAIEELRHRVGKDRPIQIVHTDLPSNDFVALFTTLAEDPSSYLNGTANVFPSAIGRSYFAPIFPPSTVNLGWNTWTVHWMSGEIILAADHVFPGLSLLPTVLADVRKRQEEDWRAFLSSRSKEHKKGARLLSAFVGRDSDGTGWNWIGDHFWYAIEDLGRKGVLDKDEMLRMTVPANGRTLEQIREPFGDANHFEGLKIVKAEMLIVPDNVWKTYQDNHDKRLLGTTHANMIRAISGPVLANVLASRSDAGNVLDKIYSGLSERLASDPKVHEGRLALVVLEKS
jgi:hypothetical protein